MRLIIINLAVCAGILLLVELIFRFGPIPEAEFPPKGSQATVYAPYTMFNIPPTGLREVPMIWKDTFRNGYIDAVQSRNNHGYRMDEDVDPWQTPVKQPGERIVVLTGGSAMFGVGSSSDDTTIDAYMQRELNSRQDKIRYRVLNFSMGSWNAFQQLVGLMLYARPYDPDWIVAMDGRNDIAICCGHMQGAGRTLFDGMIASYINSYLANNPRPDFYRSKTENWLVTHSAAYRKITHKTPVPDNRRLISAEYGYEVGTEVRWNDVKKQIAFYLRTQQMLVEQFPRARIILSLQPMSEDPDKLFAKKETAIVAMDKKFQDKELSAVAWTEFLRVKEYFFYHVDRTLRDFAASAPSGRVRYYNIGYAFPKNEETRETFFIDNMHLRDEGAEQVGRFYALKILAADFPEDRAKHAQALTQAYPYFRWPSVEP